MAQFKKNNSLKNFQEFIDQVYALPDDRFYSVWDLLTHVHRFAMRALKGIRKDDHDKLRLNLIISLSWLMATANRLHINLEKEVWLRLPGHCPYSAQKPCSCKKIKSAPVKSSKKLAGANPKSLARFQKMFEEIYPADGRSLADAGVHLAEETGEISEAVHHFLGEHLPEQFDAVILELADCVSCVFGVANSAKIDVALELEKMFYNNCHICHQAPCTCSFSEVAVIKT